MTVLTKNAITEALNKAVEEKGGDYIYITPDGYQAYPESGLSCRYSDHDGNPSCIVGFVVAALDPEGFAKLAQHEESEGESFGVDLIDEYDFAKFEAYETISALQAAQSVQDDGMPWSYAQEAYNRVLAGESQWAVQNDLLERWDAERCNS